MERTLQQQLSGNAVGKVGQKNKSARSVQRNAPKQNRTRKSGSSSRIDELLAKKSPMYVEVLNDGDDSSDSESEDPFADAGESDRRRSKKGRLRATMTRSHFVISRSKSTIDHG